MKPRLGTIYTGNLLSCRLCSGELEGAGTTLVCVPCGMTYSLALLPAKTAARAVGRAWELFGAMRLLTGRVR